MSFIDKTLKFEGFDQDALESIDVPTIKNESWKYTNFERLYSEPLKPSQETTPAEVISDGAIPTLMITGASFSDEVEFNGILARPSTEQEYKSFIERDDYFSKGFLASLINAAPTLFVTVEQKDLAGPSELHFHNPSETQVNLVILGDVKEEQALSLRFSGKGSYHVHVWGELSPNQRLEHVIFQEMENESIFLFETHYNIPRDAHYSQILIQKGAGFARHNISAKLTEKGAECDLHGLYKPHADAHIDNCSHIEHAAPHTYSRQVYKGIITGKAKGIFAGIVKVNNNCPLIEAEQLNKNLLLSTNAQAFSRPQMQIDTDDVKCAHGSTTGQLSEAELFYFESRGIRKEKARSMLADGFAMDVLLKIKNKPLREETTKRLRG